GHPVRQPRQRAARSSVRADPPLRVPVVAMPILCGTDLSKASTGALDVARALAAQRGDREVVLVHVVDGDAADPDADADAALAVLRTRLAAQAAAAAATPGPAVRSALVIGPPDQTLIGVAETEASDLIVIAAH